MKCHQGFSGTSTGSSVLSSMNQSSSNSFLAVVGAEKRMDGAVKAKGKLKYQLSKGSLFSLFPLNYFSFYS